MPVKKKWLRTAAQSQERGQKLGQTQIRWGEGKDQIERKKFLKRGQRCPAVTAKDGGGHGPRKRARKKTERLSGREAHY